MQRTLLISLTVVSWFVSIYLWHELRAERRVAAQQREFESQIVSIPATTPALLPQPQATVAVATKESVDAQQPAAETRQVPVDFNRLLNEGKIAAEAHADFLTQPQDGVVAFEMENKWRQYYAGRPEILQYGQPEIQCGARMCEIRLLATGSMEPSKWYSTIMHGRSMSAYPIPPGQSVAFDVLEDRGVTAIIGLAVHNKPKQQVQK